MWKLASTRIFILYSLAVIVGCSSSHKVSPLTDNPADFAKNDGEQRIIKKAEKLHQQLVRKGLVYREQSAQDYIEHVYAKIRPEKLQAAYKVKFYILKDASVNAFALPNGYIYLHTGLLTRISSEAQLAYVMAHELAHVIQRHGYQGSLERRSKLVTAHVSDLMLMGTGVSYIPAMVGLASFTRDAEREADSLAVNYLRKGGYDLGQISTVFSHVLLNVKPRETVFGSIYSSHPDNQERIQNTLTMIKQVETTGMIGQAEYRQFRQPLVDLNILALLRNGKGQLALESVKREIMSANKNLMQLMYYEGEAHRLLAEKPRIAAKEHAYMNGMKIDEGLIKKYQEQRAHNYVKAKEAYTMALEIDGESIEPLKGLGLVAFGQDDMAKAVEQLSHYLRVNPTAKDRRYIESIINKAKAEI